MVVSPGITAKGCVEITLTVKDWPGAKIPEIKNNICVIKSNQIIDFNQFLKELTLILKTKLNYNSNDIKKFIQKYKVGLTENKIHYVDLNTVIQQKLILKRIIDMKILTKYIDYEYEKVN